MYYPRLEFIGEKLGLPNEMTARVDQWLSMLPSYRLRALLPSDVARDVGLSPRAASQFFATAAQVGFLRPVYGVFCPACEELVDQFTDADDLESECYCVNDHAFIPADHPDYIRVAYEVVDKPKKKDAPVVAL